MAVQLNELDNTLTNDEGLKSKVIFKQIPVEVGLGSKIFEIALWLCFIVPGVLFQILKVMAQNYFDQLQQNIQKNASQIDNYLEQRVVVLRNCAGLIDRAVSLDESTFSDIANLRTGSRSDIIDKADAVGRELSFVVEQYPELKAHQAIVNAQEQNLYLQKEITAARELYNDSVNEWNKAIFQWPVKKIVAAKNGYTTRIPFVASTAVREAANDIFF